MIATDIEPHEPLNSYEKLVAFSLACQYLQPLELIALYLRFSGFTLVEIGEFLHVSTTRADQIVDQGAECLRSHL